MYHVWQPDEIEFIKSNYLYVLSRKEVAKKFNTTEAAIERLRRKIKLPSVDKKKLQEVKGYNKAKLTKWTEKKIIDTIKERHKNNQSICSDYLQKHNKALFGGAIGRFGSWKNAIEAAGLDYKQISLYASRAEWNKEKIVSEIKKLHKQKKDLSRTNVYSFYPQLVSAASNRQHFKSWKKAIEAAGINYNDVIGKKWGTIKKGVDGKYYDSIAEKNVADYLHKLLAERKIISYNTHVFLSLKRKFTCDFVVKTNNLELIWVEVDGLGSSRKGGVYDDNHPKIQWYKKYDYNYIILKKKEDFIPVLDKALLVI